MAVDQPKPRPKGLGKKPKYVQGQGLGDLELRADLEPYMYGNPLARLGYELYKEGKIDLRTDKGRGRVPGGSYGTFLKKYGAKKTGKKQGIDFIQTPVKETAFKDEVFENADKELNLDPRRVLVHELTHAAIEAVEGRERNRLRNLNDEYAFEGKPYSPRQREGFNKYGGVDYEEGVVRAGDELITGRLTGESGTAGIPGLQNYISGSKIDSQYDEARLKNRFISLSTAAQDLLTEKGVAPESIAPSDNRDRSFSEVLKYLVGFGKERNKLNNLGFGRVENDNVYRRDARPSFDRGLKAGRRDPSSTNPLKLKEGGALMAATGLTPLLDKTSNPTGNKPKKEKKMPQRGAKPTTVDPRDEALKLVAKKMKQDKTQIGIATPTGAMPMDPTQEMVMPMPMSTALAAPTMPMNPEEVPMPIKAAKGKAIEDGSKTKKKGKGLAVVIEMGSAEKPEYEEASMGTPSDPPPGATADEVKDNQHVLLSEGELVVPANVVRYHGLGMYEGMRREALQGLGEMEDAGQVEYIDNEVKTAAAGMTIMNAPNVATSQGIAKQQQQFTPGATPEAASARYVSTGFVDKNRDGVDDKMQKLSLPVPTSTVNTTPSGLRLGPTTDANTVVGAGNVGSYVDEQRNPGDDDGTTPPPKDDTPAPVAPAKVIQQPSGDDGGDPGINAGLGGATATIGGVDYALQYDFSGNLTGIANVADALATGKANFQSPTAHVANLVSSLNKGQIGMISPSNIAAGKAGLSQQLAIEANKGLAQVTNPTNISVAATKDVQAANADIMGAGIANPNALAAPEVQAPSIANIADYEEAVGKLGMTTAVDRMGMEKAKEAIGASSPDTKFDGMLSADGKSLGSIGTLSREEAAFLSGVTDTITSNAQQKGALTGVSDVPTQATMDRDKAFRDEVAAKNAKDALDAQMKGIAMGFAASTVAPGTATNAAISGKGYSSTGAAPAGSQYSSTGTFSTSSSADDTGVGSSGDLGGATGAGYGAGSDGVDTDDDDSTGASTGVGGSASGVDGMSGGSTSSSATAGTTPGTSYADDAQGSGGGPGGKIVCTEMYRQTQLDDWAQAMKTWHIYQKKYLTPIHEIGYHSLFKPFVRGMKVNKALTNLGAYLAKERTKHLRHILTKGKSADSIVGNVFCKIIHPIVYLVGLAVHKK